MMKKKHTLNPNFFLLLAFSILMFSSNLFCQIYSEKNVEIFKSKFKLAIDKNLEKETIGNVIVEIGKSFLGTEYVAHTLEKEGDEQLVINLTGLDCTTFLESTLALSLCIKKNNTIFDGFEKELTFIRYRNGKIEKYPSRLHYFSDWIFNNQQKGIIKDITKQIGGKKIKFYVNFMSENPQYYKQLKENPAFIHVIKKQEEQINKREYYYIPKSKIKLVEKNIRNGDLIAITTSDKGLDIGHVGIAVEMKDRRIHFMHAPIVGSKVQITEIPLSDYVNKIKKDTGIIVLRVQEPKANFVK